MVARIIRHLLDHLKACPAPEGRPVEVGVITPYAQAQLLQRELDPFPNISPGLRLEAEDVDQAPAQPPAPSAGRMTEEQRARLAAHKVSGEIRDDGTVAEGDAH